MPCRADDIWTRVEEALDDVGLAHAVPLDHPTSALSGGQKQRLALAGILAMRPGLILLDEPTANLDPAGVLEVRDAVGRCLDKTGATLVVVEHRVGVWKDLVDRIVVLQPGSATDSAVLLDGPPDQVLARPGTCLLPPASGCPGTSPPPVARRAGRCRGPRSGDCPRASCGRAWWRSARCREPPPGSGEPGCFARKAAPPAFQDRPAGPRAVRHHGPGPVRAGADHHGTQRFREVHVCPHPCRPSRSRWTARCPPPSTFSGGAGIDPYKWKAEQLIARIGTVFQEPEHQFVTGRVLDELMFGPRHLGHGEERVDELLERLRLTSLVDANPYTLSGGEKRGCPWPPCWPPTPGC